MRKLKKFLIIAVIALSGSIFSSAQVIIRVHPPRPVVVRTVAPSPRHVWVEEEWRPRGDRYEWAGGYWTAPPREGLIWRPGHWRRVPGGESWVPGHWGRRR